VAELELCAGLFVAAAEVLGPDVGVLAGEFDASR
jgi:hypothetical protein